MTLFWQRWLTVWSFGIALFGLVLFGAGFVATSGPSAAVFAFLGNPLATEPDRFLRFTTSLMGAVTFGWGATSYILFRALAQLERASAAPLWRLLTALTLMWYVIDSAASIANCFALNAFSNTFFMVAFLIPIFVNRVVTES